LIESKEIRGEKTSLFEMKLRHMQRMQLTDWKT